MADGGCGELAFYGFLRLGRVVMLQRMSWSAPFFLLLGTTGLLLNELVFDWGRLATIFFATLNIIGLAQFVIVNKQLQKSERTDDA